MPLPHPVGIDPKHPYRLCEADDTALARLRGLVALIGDLAGYSADNPRAQIDIDALHATCWLIQEQLDTVIGRYNIDFQTRRTS